MSPKGRNRTMRRTGQAAGRTAAVGGKIQSGNQRVQSAGTGRKKQAAGQPSIKKQLARRLAGQATGKSVSAAKKSVRKYAGKEASKVKNLIREAPGSGSLDIPEQPEPGQDALMDVKQSLQSGQNVLHRTEGTVQKIYRAGSDSSAAYRTVKEYHAKKKASKKVQAGQKIAAVRPGPAVSSASVVGRAQTVRKKSLKKSTGRSNATKRKPVKALSTSTASTAKSVKKKGKKAAGKVAVMSVQTTAKTAATAASVAGKAGSVAINTVAAVTGTAAKTAATAATGGSAGIGFAISAMAKKALKIFQEIRKNNPFKQIFRMPEMGGVAEELIKKGMRRLLLSVTIPIAALAILCGGFLFLFAGLIGTVSTSPIRFVLFNDEELEEMAPLIEFMDQEEDSFGFSGSVYEDAYNAHMQTMNEQLSAYREDGYEVIYDGYEGTGLPDNYSSVLACMVGLGSETLSGEESAGYTLADALLGADSAMTAFQELLQEMCTLTVNTEAEQVIVTLMGCEEYIDSSGCSSQEAENIRAVYDGLASVQWADSSGQELPEDMERYLSGLTHLPAPVGTVIQSAIGKLGMPYSQAQRDSGSYYDCSSFVYYSYKSAGITLSYGGANTAAAEAQYCTANGELVDVGELQPGDLLFYSYANNGRYKNISHVAMYLGRGLIIDCTEEPGVSVREFSDDRLVMCGRPYPY